MGPFAAAWNWSRDADNVDHSDRVVLRAALHPGWYRVIVLTDGAHALIRLQLSFADHRAPDISTHLEPLGGGTFGKTLKLSCSLESCSVTLGGRNSRRIDRVKFERISALSVMCFMTRKMLIAVYHNAASLSWAKLVALSRQVLSRHASFAFRSSYRPLPPDLAYRRWREIHENQATTEETRAALREMLGNRRLRLFVLCAKHTHCRNLGEISRSLAGLGCKLQLLERNECGLPALSDGTREDLILVLDRTGELPQGAVEKMALQFAKDAELEGLFADSDLLDAMGNRYGPQLKPPVWDHYLLECRAYIGSPLMVRYTGEVQNALSLPGADRAPGYAVALAIVGLSSTRRLSHLPEILFHEQCQNPLVEQRSAELELLREFITRQRIPAEIKLEQSGIRRLCYPSPPGFASIVIPTRDNGSVLQRCIESIRGIDTGYNYEIVIADNGSTAPATLSYLRTLEETSVARVVPLPGPFNFSRINNLARRSANGDVLLFLNDDTEALSKGWLAELASLALQPCTGAVGALLLYPDGTVQHGGVVLDDNGLADYAFRFAQLGEGDYLDLLRCRRTVTAVTGACLAVSAAKFDDIGGFDEQIEVALNDIDLCLRLRQRGLKNIWSPWACLKHWESKSRGLDASPAALHRLAREINLFREKWPLSNPPDPLYHPLLNQQRPDYSLAM